MNPLRAFNPSSWRRLGQRVRDRATDLALKRINLGWKLKSGISVRIATLGDWTVFSDIFAEGEYDIAIEAVASHSESRALNILDLGANVGFFSARVAHVLLTRGVKSFQITCIEGSPTVYSELKRRIQASPPLAERTKLVQGLVGLRQGTAAIADSPFHPMTSIFSPASDGVSVAYVDLDRVVDPNSPIDLVKCDIEGAEQQFLETYPQLLERTHLAIFEFHHDKCDTARCRELLSRSGLVHKQTIVDGPYTALQFFAREA